MKRISYVIMTADLKIISSGLLFHLRQLTAGYWAIGSPILSAKFIVQVGRVDRWTSKHAEYYVNSESRYYVVGSLFSISSKVETQLSLHFSRGFENINNFVILSIILYLLN